MTDQGVKALLGQLLRNKENLLEILSYFHAEDVEKGFLILPENLLNSYLKGFIIGKANGYLRNYTVNFTGGSIFIHADLEIKQLGPLSAKYLFTIDGLHFDRDGRKLFVSYREDVKCRGNMMQNIAFKAFTAKGPLLQSVASMANLPGLSVRGYHAAFDMDKIKIFEKIPSDLTLSYVSCEDGLLKLSFHI